MKNGLLHILYLMAILAFHSCSHEWFDGDKRCLNSAVEEARSYFEGNATDLSMPQLMMPPETKTDDILSGGNLVPVWDRFITAENDRFTTFEIPLSRDFAMRAAMFYPQDGKHKFVTENVRVQSNLVIRKSKKSGNFNYFVSTVIGSSAVPAEKDNNPWRYLGSRKGFNGYVIISNVEGDILETFYYRNGNRFFITLKNQAQRDSLCTNRFGFIVGRSMPLTKGGSYETGESQSLCIFCNKPLVDYECDCPGWQNSKPVMGEYVYCDKCGMLKGHCVCGNYPCPLCGKEPCECSGQEYNCEYCGSPYCNGRCQSEGDNRGGGDNTPTPDPEEEPQDLYTVTIAEPVGGSATGGGGYKKGSTATISAIPDEGYVFAGWSGDYSGLDNPASFTVEDDMTIYARFYEESSECGKLVKNLESLPYLMRCREKIGSGTGLTEYGYIKTTTSIEEIEGRNNAITIRDLPNTLELAHTHIDVIYPSIEDLKSIYRRYHKGCISDYENFKYIIVSPEYFVVIKIEDTDRMDVLIRDSLIIQKVITDDNKYRYKFSEEIEKKYDRFIPIQSNSVDGHFSNFMDFFEYLNPGLSISVYKTDTESGEMTYKKVSNREDFSKLLNRTGICNN